jgi:hypothetical protein
LSLVACGDSSNKHTFNDAMPSKDGAVVHDAAPDAPPATGVVKITVYDTTGVLAAGTPVVFLDASGATVLEVATDANGVAMATMGPGGSVTALRPNGAAPPALLGTTQQHLYTFEGVKPGDQLQLGTPAGPGVGGSVTVTLPAISGAANYIIRTACGSTGFSAPSGSGAPPPIGTVNYTDCALTGLSAEAFDAFGVSMGTFYKPTQVLTGAIDLSAETYKPNKTLALTASNIPAVVTSVNAEVDLFVGAFDLYWLSKSLTLGTGSATGSYDLADQPGAMVSHVNVYRQIAGETIVRAEATPAAWSMDVGANLIPWLPSFAVIDTDTHSLAWTEVGAGTATAISANLYASGPSVSYDWNIVAPYTARKLVLPVLPTSLASFNIQPTYYSYVNNVGIVQLPAGAWDVVRPVAFDHDPAQLLFSQGTGTPMGVVTFSSTNGGFRAKLPPSPFGRHVDGTTLTR